MHQVRCLLPGTCCHVIYICAVELDSHYFFQTFLPKLTCAWKLCKYGKLSPFAITTTSAKTTTARRKKGKDKHYSQLYSKQSQMYRFTFCGCTQVSKDKLHLSGFRDIKYSELLQKIKVFYTDIIQTERHVTCGRAAASSGFVSWALPASCARKTFLNFLLCCSWINHTCRNTNDFFVTLWSP